MGSGETRGRGEIVYSVAHHCRFEMLPSPEYELHIPLKDDGTEDLSEVYTKGKVSTKILNTECGWVVISHKENK